MSNDLQTNLDIIDDFTQRLQVAVIGAEETTAKHEKWVEGTDAEVIQTSNGPIKTLRGLISEWRILADQTVATSITGYDQEFQAKLEEFDVEFINYLLTIGFEPAIIYQPGITITRRPQTVAYQGVTYYWGGTLPHTTTGDFSTEVDWLIAPVVGGVEIPQMTFSSGGTIVRKTQSVLGTDGEWYFWTGSFPKVVPSGSTLESAGGVGLNKFKPASGSVPLRPLMKIVATAAGVVLNAGSFEYGATITSSSQVLAEFGTGRIWKWDGPIPKVVDANSNPVSSGGTGLNLWNEITTATGTSGAGITISENPPTGVGSGHRWYCTVDGRTYIRYADGDSVQWVEESPQSSFVDGMEPRVREAHRRLYGQQGFVLAAGSFESGGILLNAKTVLLSEANGKAYSGNGPFPQTVTPGTDPNVGGFTFVDIDQACIENYTGLREFTGAAKVVFVTGVLGTTKPEGIAGIFEYDATDTTSTDNGGTVIVGDDGRRWKRQYNGIPSVLWWGAKPDWNGVTGTDNTAALQAAHNAHAVLFYPYGSYKTGSITLTKFGATLVGPGELYGMAELVYTGSGTLFTCTAGTSYVQFKSGMYLHGIPAVATDYYNTGSIAIDITAGNTSLIFDGSWVNSFEILFNSNYNNFYNRFTNNRLERFRIGLNKFSSNNLHIEKNRISRFNTAIVANGGNGPLVIDKNAFEVFNGPIASMSGVEQGEIVFTNNYVELYDSVYLPTNFPPSDAPNTGKFGGNILFTGPIGSFKQSGNDLQIGGCRRIMSTSLHVDVIESVGNNIHIFTTGNNLDSMWVAPSVGSININDRLGGTQGANGGYSRTYAGLALAQLNPNRPYFFYDCIAGKSFRANAETFALALLNGWTNSDANHGVARVHKKDGVVRLSGVVDGTARTGVEVFNIPVAYRPDEVGNTRAYANFSCFSAYGGGTVVRLRYVYSAGDLRMEGSPASVAAIALDGIVLPVRT